METKSENDVQIQSVLSEIHVVVHVSNNWFGTGGDGNVSVVSKKVEPG